ncbi:hypothetical protein CYMTET_28511 [Cymbomonas tetramitiformis]|uniref:Uncharacterized protein n=1 Tax=Cymbomonas tetramitiformis TaxID=36881 RepID=A0AAE0FMT8_9CHLO|nr:hypothetical protein CYMTET_28511 [Cymbomonas tetramitiformis]
MAQGCSGPWADGRAPVRLGPLRHAHYAGGTPGTAAAVGVFGDDKADRDDIIKKLLSRLDKIGAFIISSNVPQRMGGEPAVLPSKRNRKGLDGFRVGVGHDPRVGFDPGAKKKALPKCPRCTRRLRTAARMLSRQRWREQHGAAPAVVKAGAAFGGVDVSAVMESDDSEDNELDVQEELRQLRSQIGKQGGHRRFASTLVQATLGTGMHNRTCGMSTTIDYARQHLCENSENFERPPPPTTPHSSTSIITMAPPALTLLS